MLEVLLRWKLHVSRQMLFDVARSSIEFETWKQLEMLGEGSSCVAAQPTTRCDVSTLNIVNNDANSAINCGRPNAIKTSTSPFEFAAVRRRPTPFRRAHSRNGKIFSCRIVRLIFQHVRMGRVAEVEGGLRLEQRVLGWKRTEFDND